MLSKTAVFGKNKPSPETRGLNFICFTCLRLLELLG